MTVLNLYQLEPTLASNLREALEVAAAASKGTRRTKLYGLLRELEDAYTKWDEDEAQSAVEPEMFTPEIVEPIVEPFDPFDL
jgi:hypothetical protein